MADDIKKVIEQATEQIREDIKGVGITVEAVQSDVQHISEAVDSHSHQLGQLEMRDQPLRRYVGIATQKIFASSRWQCEGRFETVPHIAILAKILMPPR